MDDEAPPCVEPKPGIEPGPSAHGGQKLLVGKEYTFGRRDCDILITNDMSISRKHAMFTVSHPENYVTQPQKLPNLSMSDLSRLGTMVGDKRVTQESCLVSSGTVMMFGSAGVTKYTAIYKPYIVTTSCLDASGKKMTRQLICRLGGHVISEWRKDCGALVMNSLSITIKAICALIAMKPIVTPKYFEHMVNSIESNKGIPNPETYLPPLAESQLDPTQVSFLPDPRRQKVFQGRIFIFLSNKQFKKLSIAVELGGGTPMLLEEGTDDNEDDILIGRGSCVMSCDPADQSQQLTANGQEWITHVMQTLKKCGKRLIQECEIGYSVLYCSVDRYCNPDCDINAPVQRVAGQTLSEQPLPSQAVAPDTGQINGSEFRATTKAPITVKSEPASQREAAPKVTNVQEIIPSRKRNRDVDSDIELAPASKRLSKENVPLNIPPIQIKSEPLTQPTSPARELRRSPRAGASRSPSPVPQKQTSPRPKGRAGDTTNNPTSGGTRQRVKSPSPEAHRPTNRNKNKPPTLVPDSDEETYMVEEPRSKKSRRVELSEDDQGSGEDDLFSTIPKRKGRGRDKISSNVRNRRSPSPIEDPSSPARDSKSFLKAANKAPAEDIESDVITADQNVKKKEELDRPKAALTLKTEPCSPTARPVTGRATEITGFLTTSKPTTDQVPIDSDFEYDKSLCKHGALVEEKSLLVRKPGQVRGKTFTGADVTTWKGKRVNNFKKFRKVTPSHGLPTVIGGTDLVAHDSSQNRDMEKWVADYLQTSTEQSQAEREADELFSYRSRPATGRARRR